MADYAPNKRPQPHTPNLLPSTLLLLSMPSLVSQLPGAPAYFLILKATYKD